MDFLTCMDNFPWNRFATAYETHSTALKDRFVKMYNGTASASDYQYVVDRLECQATLYRITPWGVRFYIDLLSKGKANKEILLQNIKVLFEAANFNTQIDTSEDYRPTKGNLLKYEKIEAILFKEDFEGTLDAEFLKTFKSIDRNFMQRLIMELIGRNIPLFEHLSKSSESGISTNASSLLDSIRAPRKYKFETD